MRPRDASQLSVKKCLKCDHGHFVKHSRVVRKQETAFRGVGGPPIIAALFELSWKCAACGHTRRSFEQPPLGDQKARPPKKRVQRATSRKVKQLPEVNSRGMSESDRSKLLAE